MDYLVRDYRLRHRQEDLVHFRVAVGETDLDVAVRKERFSKELVSLVEKHVRELRGQIEDYIKADPGFLKSLFPCDLKPGAPAIATTMAEAARSAGVGPMAAVAGAISEAVGKILLKHSRDVIVENGGDIYLRTRRNRLIGIFAGGSVFSHRIGLEIRPEDTPAGICTSSGTVGHSLSFGCADAVVVVSPSAPLADAVATAAGNIVRTPADLEKVVEFAASIPGVTGAVIIMGHKLAAKGKIKLLPLK
ncbi:MAG: UPF0280 family protein [Peptococcaceae bacterium]|nr:UPF0280 family protein [Peptococcaceae bacterium]